MTNPVVRLAQTRVTRLMQVLIDRDVERGLQVAAYLDGELARAPQVEIRDRVSGTTIARTLGYGPGEPSPALGGRRRGFADPEYSFAFALTKTRLVSALPGQDAAYLIARETLSALGIPGISYEGA